MIEQRAISLSPVSEVKKNAPTITHWKGQSMIRSHSIRATILEILNVIKVLDVVKIGIVGEPATGKTTLMRVIGHLVHKMSDVPFAVRIFGEEEFLNMKETLDHLDPVNYVLGFDDVSFLYDKKKIEQVKNAITKIRHLKSDVKIVLINNYHYTLGVDKYLRQANFRYFTSVGSSEEENMIKIVGAEYAKRVKDFQKKFVENTTRHFCTFHLPQGKFQRYNYKNPFSIALFYNNQTLRYVIFPKREWIDKICSVCEFANNKMVYSEIPIDQFIKESEKKFGQRIFRSACKLHLFQNGLNTYARSLNAAHTYLGRAFEKKIISLEAVRVHYGLDITRTKLHKKLDGVLEENNVLEGEELPKSDEDKTSIADPDPDIIV